MTSAWSISPENSIPIPRMSTETGCHWLVAGRRDNASSASTCICSTPSLQSKARTVAAQASRGLPSGIGPSDWAVSTASAQRSAASGRPRSACTQAPDTAIAGYRSSRSESSKCASQRSTVVTRPLR